MSGWQAALIEISRSTATRIPDRTTDTAQIARRRRAMCSTVPPAYNTRVYEWPPPRIYYDVCISIIIGCSLSVPAGWRSPIYDFIAIRAGAGGVPRIPWQSPRARSRPLLLLFLSFSDFSVTRTLFLKKDSITNIHLLDLFDANIDGCLTSSKRSRFGRISFYVRIIILL